MDRLHRHLLRAAVARFWAESVNALTNGAFLLAALWGAVTARRLGVKYPVAWLLIVLAGLIGVGSFLFHTYATSWAELADTAPIWTFVAVFVLAAMRYIRDGLLSVFLVRSSAST